MTGTFNQLNLNGTITQSSPKWSRQPSCSCQNYFNNRKKWQSKPWLILQSLVTLTMVRQFNFCHNWKSIDMDTDTGIPWIPKPTFDTSKFNVNQIMSKINIKKENSPDLNHTSCYLQEKEFQQRTANWINGWWWFFVMAQANRENDFRSSSH